MLEAHWRYVRQMHDEGKLLVAGPSWVGDDPFGIGVVDLRERAEVGAWRTPQRFSHVSRFLG